MIMFAIWPACYVRPRLSSCRCFVISYYYIVFNILYDRGKTKTLKIVKQLISLALGIWRMCVCVTTRQVEWCSAHSNTWTIVRERTLRSGRRGCNVILYITNILFIIVSEELWFRLYFLARTYYSTHYRHVEVINVFNDEVLPRKTPDIWSNTWKTSLLRKIPEYTTYNPIGRACYQYTCVYTIL